MSARTWVDVTDLVSWKGRATGIPRVLASLATRYAEDPLAGFFSYRHGSRQFLEVRREDVQQYVVRLTIQGTVAPSLAAATRASQVAAAARDRLRRLPYPIRVALRRFEDMAHPVAKRASFLARSFARPAQSVMRATLRKDRRLAPEVTFGPHDRVLILGHGWAQASLQSELGHRKLTTGNRVYQLLYDLAPVHYPQAYGPGFSDTYARYLHEALSISDGIFAISASTRSDALRLCNDLLISPPPIEVIRLGDELGSVEPRPIDRLVDEDFVLSVGTVELRKNHALLYQAWRLAAERGVTLPRLVIVGRPGWGASDTRYAMTNDPMLKDSLLLLEDASDGELEWLYRQCRMTIYPSLYEGWGLPIAESLSRGKVCLASGSSAMPEVAGDLIEYFSPYSPDELLAKITTYLDPIRLASKEREIGEGYRPTTWDETYSHVARAIGTFESGRTVPPV